MKIEMHTHTSEVSPCASVEAEMMVRLYSDAGYGAVVVTDHYNDYVIESFSGPPDKRVERYLLGYKTAKEVGEWYGVKILLGVETCIFGGMEDFLIYGIDENFIYNNPKMYNYTQKELYNRVEEYGALLYQAHPCRAYCNPRDPLLLHGVEVYNGNPRHDNNNHKALKWTKRFQNLRYSSGSDFHQQMDLARGGIEVPDEISINTIVDLSEYLRNTSVKLIES